jgi:alpha-1,2-mannosyltransferase
VAVLLAVVATALDPVRTTLYLGQINIVLLALVVGDLLGRSDSRWRGVGVGVAAAVKLTPLLFVAFLLATRRWRAAAIALATFVAAAGLGFLFAPADSVAFWFKGTFLAADRISDVGGPSNHSLNGLLSRLGAEELLWFAVAAVLGVATIALAVRAHRAGEEVLALTLCGLASAALAPFAWSHHYVWVVPLAVLLGARAVAGNRWAAAGLAGVLGVAAAVVTALPGPHVGPIPATGLISVWPDAYLLLFVAALVTAIRSHTGRGAGAPAASIVLEQAPAVTPTGSPQHCVIPRGRAGGPRPPHRWLRPGSRRGGTPAPH